MHQQCCYLCPNISRSKDELVSNHKSHWLQVKIWFQNRRMKWKRSKKAHQDAKRGESSSSSGTAKESRSSASRSRSPHNHHNNHSSEDEKSGGGGKHGNEKGFSSNSPGDVLVSPPPPPHAHPHPHQPAPPPPPPSRLLYGGTGNMDFSSATADIGSKEQERRKFEDNNGGATALLMKRPPLFFPEDANGEMFRPYVS